MCLRSLAAAAVLVWSSGAAAEAPNVVVDIAPVHSLVASVMQGVGEPALILHNNASAHDYAMRPSDARALADADLVISVGAALAPWFAKAATTLAPSAHSLELLEVTTTELLPFRTHGQHRFDDKHNHAHDHAIAGHIDPHAWLDPHNAKIWLAAIAARLIAVDGDNAAEYERNLKAALVEMKALNEELATTLAGVSNLPFAAAHDAYQYLETRFDLASVGSLSNSDDVKPGVSGVAAFKESLRAAKVSCVVVEAAEDIEQIQPLLEGTGVSASVLDPLGRTLEPGPNHYHQTMRGLANTLAECLSGPT